MLSVASRWSDSEPVAVMQLVGVAAVLLLCDCILGVQGDKQASSSAVLADKPDCCMASGEEPDAVREVGSCTDAEAENETGLVFGSDAEAETAGRGISELLDG